jgi:hypothetical protein
MLINLVSYVIVAVFVSISNPELVALRKQYELAEQSKQLYHQFIQALTIAKSLDAPIKKGYTGASLMIGASHEINPLTKLKYFNQGKEILEAAIVESQESIELHYLRFTIQEHSPALLGYKSKMKLDKVFLMSKMSADLKLEDDDLFSRITLNFLNGTYLSEVEKSDLKQKLRQINKQ